MISNLVGEIVDFVDVVSGIGAFFTLADRRLVYAAASLDDIPQGEVVPD
jgi:hypothetical protein